MNKNINILPFPALRVTALVLAIVFVNAVMISGVVYAEPVLELKQGDGEAYIGRPYKYICEVTWRGVPDAYAILTAEVDPIDWGTVKVSEVRSFVRDDFNVVAQTIEIIPAKEGVFETPTAKISYISPEALVKENNDAQDETVPAAPNVSPALRVTSFPLTVRSSSSLLWIATCLGVFLTLLAIIALFVWLKHKRSAKCKGKEGEISTLMRTDEVREIIHTARKHRLDGKHYDYYVALGHAAQLMSNANLGTKLKQRAEAVGYRGERPSDDLMDTDYREVERALTHWASE